MTREQELEQRLKELRRKMRKWAAECTTGGWSTNLVAPLRKEADKIDELLMRED